MAVSRSQETRLVKRAAQFTGTGTWTVPDGVTYAIAHCVGGGGGLARLNTNAGDGGTTTVAFPSGSISAPGGQKGTVNNRGSNYGPHYFFAAKNNSGRAAYGATTDSQSAGATEGVPGARNSGGGTVTPGGSVSVTVGAGGLAGSEGAAGGSGYVWIEYEQEVFV